MRVRYRVAIEIIVSGRDLADIQSRFEDIDVADIATAKEEGMAVDADFIETEAINIVNPDGTVGEELNLPLM